MSDHQVKLITIEVPESEYETVKDVLQQNGLQFNTHNKYPDCYGQMNWILEYVEGKEPWSSVCSCKHSVNCMKITRHTNSTK